MNEEEGSISIGQYVVQVSQDPERARAFRENPERAMSAAGLSEEDRDLILSGNTERVRRAIYEEFGEDAKVTFMVWTWPITWPITWG